MRETLEKFDWSKIDFVIETGTYQGASSRLFKELCDKVYTIEISDSLFAQYSPELEELGINCLLGASVDHIGAILEKEDGEFFCFFDGHGSNEITSFDPRVGRFGSPILDEIKCLGGRQPLIVIFDDLLDCIRLDGYPNPDEIMSEMSKLGKYDFQVVEKGNQQLIAIRNDA